MKPFTANIVSFIIISCLTALYLWDKSQGGNGLENITRTIKTLCKWMRTPIALVFIFLAIVAFIRSGFWTQFFTILILPAPMFLCTIMNVGFLLFFIALYVSKK
ncbi:MAG: hypothetical protein CSB13_05280 [Chloroflexi bacterium]|nr:MAG: hypothetical protein CSB13_05280 [Chloroflexota bacterium]